MNKKNFKWKYTPLGIFFITTVCAIVLLSNISIQLDGGEDGKSWIKFITLKAADNTTGGTDSIVNIYIYPMSEENDILSSPYEANEPDAYEHGDDVNGFQDGEELAQSTPVGSNYFIVVEVNFSDKAYNTTSTDWDVGLVRANITCATLSLSDDVMSEAPDFSQQSGTTSAHMTFYINNSGAGWTMTTGASITVTDLDIYYFG